MIRGEKMGLFDLFKKSENVDKSIPYSVRTSLNPIRLNAYKIESCDMRVFVKNITNEPLLTSVTVTVPKQLSVDRNGIPKTKEVRLEFLQKNEEREISIPIWSNVTTAPGTYSITLSVVAHYRSYSYILNKVTIPVEIRVV